MLSSTRGRRRPGPPLRLPWLTLVMLALGVAGAQGAERVLDAEAADPQPLVAAEDLARLLGVELQASGETLVLRGGGVVLTAFAGSAEVVVGGAGAGEGSLSAPVEKRVDGWWLPLDAGDPFGLARTGPATLTGPGGRSWRLRVRPPPAAPSRPAVRARILRPSPGAVAVELRSADGADAAERVAWLTDLALVPLIAPEVREAVDAALAEAGATRALLLVVTARTDGSRTEGVAIDADGRELLSSGERHVTLAGDAESIGPQAPWVALVWLPPGTRLDRPLTVRWEGALVEVAFRR